MHEHTVIVALLHPDGCDLPCAGPGGSAVAYVAWRAQVIEPTFLDAMSYSMSLVWALRRLLGY